MCPPDRHAVAGMSCATGVAKRRSSPSTKVNNEMRDPRIKVLRYRADWLTITWQRCRWTHVRLPGRWERRALLPVGRQRWF